MVGPPDGALRGRARHTAGVNGIRLSAVIGVLLGGSPVFFTGRGSCPVVAVSLVAVGLTAPASHEIASSCDGIRRSGRIIRSVSPSGGTECRSRRGHMVRSVVGLHKGPARTTANLGAGTAPRRRRSTTRDPKIG